MNTHADRHSGSGLLRLEGDSPPVGARDDSPSSAPQSHPLHLDPASRLAAILGETDPLLSTEVNSYHHQAVRPEDLAPTLVASAVAPHDDGDLVEALESTDPHEWLIESIPTAPNHSRLSPAKTAGTMIRCVCGRPSDIRRPEGARIVSE